MRHAALLFAIATSTRAAQQRVPHIVHDDRATHVAGDPSGIVIEGAKPGESLTITARRTIIRSRRAPATGTDTATYESYATFRADRAGQVKIDQATPTSGSWSVADSRGLFWSMTRNSNAEPVVPGRISLQLRQGDRVVDSLSLAIRSSRLEITSRAVVEPGLAGAYAAPKGATRAPAIILLHGSEGGDTTSALIMARRFAARGYAAFAAIYVAYPWTGAQYPGIPTVFDSLPLERVDSARAWLGRQLEADTSRTSIWGGSKGAELALVVGSRRQWPSAIVACVPSDIVWAGFGRTAEPGKPLSSWSDRGERLAAVQYDRYEDVFNDKATSREVHDRSRRQNATEVAPARIPVEKIRAPLLLLGSERDEVWASGQMAREIARRKKSTLAYYEGAGHGICSDGMAPWETFGRGPDPDPRATARSAADAWRRTIAFLAQHAR